MNFAHYSNPEREAPIRTQGVEFLKDCREKIAAMPDPLKDAPVKCPLCLSPIAVTVGKRSNRFFFHHPKSSCDRSDDIHSFSAESRELAIEKWQDEATA